jgi:DUF917 family protein
MQAKLKGGHKSSNQESSAFTGQSGSSFKQNRVHHTMDMAEELGEGVLDHQFKNGDGIPGIGEISNLRKSLKTMMRDRI